MRLFAALLALSPLVACAAPTGPIDAGACPADLGTSTACTVENTACTQTSRCTVCARGRYMRYGATCTCSNGFWYCSVPECTITMVATFADPECSIPFGSDAGSDVTMPDAGVDASGDASTDATADVVDDMATDDASASDSCAPRPDASAASDAGCASGRLACDGVCVDLASDPRHCGACGNQCLPFQICSAGVCGCECAAGLTVCSAGCNACACHDLQTDPTHCGSCATACATGEVCVAGVCTRP
jgi:hypothetical protein